ncbi:glycosyltransferase family 4 protein [Nostoc sp. UHCC 0302]|uniref:glycosyltransferase family 4 protein n=1 Tax=Nostoc sp. UHCC 0302 TaxID=3134896 RepID=UPI00311C9BCF
MEKMKSIFVPRAIDDNPYQNQLILNLQQLGTYVERPNHATRFLPTFFLLTIFSHWKPDIVHFHWLHPLFLEPNNNLKTFFKTLAFITQVVILKITGIKIIWTVHNLKNHENTNLFLDYICTNLIVTLSSAIITHCEAAKEEFIKKFPLRNQDKVFVIPHGNYIDSYENKIEKSIARKSLGLTNSGTVFLFLGLIRPYKGVLELIETFKTLDSEECELIIAGKVYDNNQEMMDLLLQKIADDKRIKLIPTFVPPEQVQTYMNASDVVVFPYRDVLTSGAVLLAMSFSRACIAPRKGCIAEVLDNDGAFLYQPDENNGLREAMDAALYKQSNLLIMGKHNFHLAKKFNWKHIAEMTVDVYRSCL